MKPVNQVTALLNEVAGRDESSLPIKGPDTRAEEPRSLVKHLVPHLSFRPSERLIHFVKFCMVGGSGVLVDMGILYLLADPRILALNVTFSKISGAEVAIINNFIWNEFWTFRQSSRAVADSEGPPCSAKPEQCRRPRARGTLFHRFTLFNAFCGIGVGLAVVLLHTFHTWLGWNLYLSNLLAIILVTFWNFGMNARFSWPMESSFHLSDRSR